MSEIQVARSPKSQLRLAKQLIRVGRNARSAAMFRNFIVTLPIIALGLYAWLLGEARAYGKAITGRSD